MYKLLVRGYIRELEKAIIKQHVPSDISSLCIQYYYSNSKLILITNSFDIFITDINEDEESKNDTIWNTSLKNISINQKIKHPNEESKESGPSQSSSWIITNTNKSLSSSIENSAICAYSNITLPKYVLSATKLTGNHNNNIIFQASADPSARNCCAIILNDTDFVGVESKGILCT